MANSNVGKLFSLRALAARLSPSKKGVVSCYLRGTQNPHSGIQLQRALHDLAILPNNKPAIAYGPPGRSATTGHVATVFGCTGFLGRYLVAKLGESATLRCTLYHAVFTNETAELAS